MGQYNAVGLGLVEDGVQKDVARVGRRRRLVQSRHGFAEQGAVFTGAGDGGPTLCEVGLVPEKGFEEAFFLCEMCASVEDDLHSLRPG